jgi:hypothetical protein
MTAGEIEILERISSWLARRGLPSAAKTLLENFNESLLPPDPPQPEGREVRIAVCLSRTGLVSAQAINDDEDEDAVTASCSCVSEHLGLTLCQAIITAVIPTRAVPVVTGKVET